MVIAWEFGQCIVGSESLCAALKRFAGFQRQDPGAEEMAQGLRVLVGGRGAGELAQWLKSLMKNLDSIPSTHMEAHYLLRYQVSMWCTNVHACETLNHIKE